MLENRAEGPIRKASRNGSWLKTALILSGLLSPPWDGQARGQGANGGEVGKSRFEAADTDQALLQAGAERETEPGVAPAESSPAPIDFSIDGARLAARGERLLRDAFALYQRTPPGNRVAWGGLAVCSLLGLSILLERMVTLRARRIIPGDFSAKFLDRLHSGKLDAGSALDYCEENPSPAARIALAAVRRWGRPAADLERAVSLSHRVESDRLRRNVGTLRRIAVLAPLIGFLGTLLAAARTLASIPPELTRADLFDSELPWGPALASALMPLTAGVVVATLAVVTYDGLIARIEKLSGALDRLGEETIDAIAMTAPSAPTSLTIPTHRAEKTQGANGPTPNRRLHAESEFTRTGIFGLVRPDRHSPHLPAATPSDVRRTRQPTRPKSGGNTSAQA